MVCLHWQLRALGRRSRTTSAAFYDGECRWQEKRGSHDGLYAARVYGHDRRRLLRCLRQSSERSPVRCCRGSGVARVTRPCRRAWLTAVGRGGGRIFPGPERRGPQYRLYAARVYGHDRRRLLRCLRQSSERSPVRCCRGSGFARVTRPCRRAWLIGSRWGGGSFPGPERRRPQYRLYAAGCTGTIVDGYCDVCGSPAGAVPFVAAEAAASPRSPASADEPGLTAVPAPPPVPAPVDEEIRGVLG